MPITSFLPLEVPVNVVDLASRRATSSETSPHAACDCGSVWFELRRRPTDPEGLHHGAITMRPDGSVSAYMGVAACLDCGEVKRFETDEAGLI